jgi:hypothetical protein
VAQIIQFLFQSCAGGGLGRGVVRTDGHETRAKGDAQTEKDSSFDEMTHPREAYGNGVSQHKLDASADF